MTITVPPRAEPRARERARCGVVLELANCRRTYGKVHALDAFSITVAPGELVAVLGARLAVPASAGVGLRAGQKVDVLVRPESIRMRPASDGPAVVARASFPGAVVGVVAALPDSVEVTSTLPASDGYTFPAGARVDIALLGDVLLVVARPPTT
jgi:ABC-type Fe3+/spermidine/putrescine transport system ATPase subunit